MRRRTARDLSRQLSRLRRRGEARALAKAARALGVEVWLVGGAVRDACLGIPDAEIDAAVAGDAEAMARALESRGAGRAVFLSRGRPGPRVYRVAGRRPLDIAEIEGGSIEGDLGRRDFTVNAVAVSLADGKLLDPFGGLADLGRGRLRPVRLSNLLDDPLRALRAARLLATRGLVPDGGTLVAARAAAPRLRGVAPERIGAELSRILGSPRAAKALGWAARAGLLGPALGATLKPRRARAIASALRPFDDSATARQPEEARRRLRLAALALALGRDGAAARKWVSERRLPRREADEAGRLVELVRKPPDGSTRASWRWILEAGPLAGSALDLLARAGTPAARRRLRPALARLRRLSSRPLRRVQVSGSDVMLWLSLPAGPRIGALLGDLAVAAASGDVKNRREARNWLTGQVRGRSSAL